MEDKDEFSHEALIDTAAVSSYLRALADAFESRNLRFADKQGEMILKPNGLISFEVNTTRDGERVRLDVRFDWKEHNGESGGRNGTLQIEARDKS